MWIHDAGLVLGRKYARAQYANRSKLCPHDSSTCNDRSRKGKERVAKNVNVHTCAVRLIGMVNCVCFTATTLKLVMRPKRQERQKELQHQRVQVSAESNNRVNISHVTSHYGIYSCKGREPAGNTASRLLGRTRGCGYCITIY